MLFKKTTWLLLMLSLHAAAVDFKHQLLLESGGSGVASGYQLQLPEVVYENASNPALRDVRVKNSQGDEVPMLMTLSQDEIKQKVSAITLPVFSLNHTVNTPLRSKQVSTSWQGDIQQLTVETSESVQNFIRSQEQVLEDRLLLDASVLKPAVVTALHLKWQFDKPGNRVFYVELKGSQDLSNWKTLASRHKLIELNTGQRLVLENSIPLNDNAFKYYQLRFLGEPIPVVTEVKALLKSRALEQPLITHTVNKYKVLNPDTYGHAITWDTGGFFPVETVRVNFDYKNLMADVQLYSKNNEDSPWQRVASSELYQVGSGEMAMENNSLSFQANPSRYWKLTSQSRISSQWVKGIEFKWRPHLLKFLAQGDGPFSLYFGASELKYLPSDRWYQQLSTGMKTKLFSDQINLGSLLDLNSKPEEVETKYESYTSRLAFWGLLLVVLSSLFYMASRLMKEVGRE